MREMQEVAREYLEARKQWLALKERFATTSDDQALRIIASKWTEAEGRMRALAFVLDIDLEVMDAPRVDVYPPLQKMRLARVEETRWWLLEIPADDAPDAQIEQWAVILSADQLAELHWLIQRKRDGVERSLSASRSVAPVSRHLLRLVEPDAM